MKRYLVTYYDGNQHRVAWLESADPSATAPVAWNLPEDYDIISVIVGAQMVAAVYVDGRKVENL